MYKLISIFIFCFFATQAFAQEISTEEIMFGNEIRISGTLSLPRGEGPHPALILIHGSGSHTRNEDVIGFPIFQVLSDCLTEKGFAVFRYDKRGCGDTEGNYFEAGLADFADDAESALQYLASRTDIDPKRTGVLGHSEGAAIAGKLAHASPIVKFAVSMGGTSVPGSQIVLKQQEITARSMGVSESDIKESLEWHERQMDALISGNDKLLRESFWALVDVQKRMISEEESAQVDELLKENAETIIESLKSKSRIDFIRLNPSDDWSQAKVPVLALFGTLDTQVDRDQNIPPFKKALKDNLNFTLVELPNANHLFQKAETGNVMEYSFLPKEFDEGFLEALIDWLSQNIK